MEQTTLQTVVNQQCEQIMVGHSLYQRQFLAHPSTVELFGETLFKSSEAVLECGHIQQGDVMYAVGGLVGRILHFWKHSGTSHFVARCALWDRLDDSCIYREGNGVDFILADNIVDAMSYRPLGDGTCRVLLPYAARVL